MKYHSLLICNSNMFIPVTLTEVLSHPGSKYMVISDTDNIRQFFEMLQLPNVTYHHYGFNSKRDGRFGFIRRRRMLMAYVMQYEIGQVVFFHAEFGSMANWLIEKLSKRNVPIYYCKLYDSIPASKASLSLRKIKILLSERIYYGQQMDVLMGNYEFPSLPERFFRKVKAETITMPVDVKLNDSCLREQLKEFDIRGQIVLLTGTAIFDKWYTEERYTSFVNALIESLGVENVVSKCHPRYKELYGKENELAQIPSYIPGNLLIESFDYYIGCESTLLVEAALAGKKAISYIDWLKPDEKRQKTQHDFFENRLQGKGVIFFPTSLEELKEILNNPK